MGKELREDMRQSLQCCLIRLILPPETLVVCQKDHLWELADCSFTLALNSQKWFACNFSLQYPYTIQQTGIENTRTHQVQFITLIEHLILIINLQGNVSQLHVEGRIDSQILRVKRLNKIKWNVFGNNMFSWANFVLHGMRSSLIYHFGREEDLLSI